MNLLLYQLQNGTIDLTQTVYIAGAISSDPVFLRKFDAADEYLHKIGFQYIFNPARIVLDAKLTVADPWEQCMFVVEYLYKSKILCLFDDWTYSSGARLERISAIQRNIPIINFNDIVNAISLNNNGCYSVKQAI